MKQISMKVPSLKADFERELPRYWQDMLDSETPTPEPGILIARMLNILCSRKCPKTTLTNFETGEEITYGAFPDVDNLKDYFLVAKVSDYMPERKWDITVTWHLWTQSEIDAWAAQGGETDS